MPCIYTCSLTFTLTLFLLDNALLKVGSRMKQVGMDEEDIEWLEDHVVSSHNTTFSIKKVDEAKKREPPKEKKKKAAGSKRKVKSEKTSKKKKKVKKEVDDSDVDDDASDGESAALESVDADESMDEADNAIDLSKLTAQMEDEEESEEEDDSSEEESEEEEEAEFE